MENASKALIMAGSVLIGVLIISLAVYLFATFSEYGDKQTETLAEKQIDEFNSNFYKYYGNETVRLTATKEVTRPIAVTTHDILTVANLARQNNQNFFPDTYMRYPTSDMNASHRYIQVRVEDPSLTKRNAEQWDAEQRNTFAKSGIEVMEIEGESEKLTKYYKCTDFQVSEQTKYVYKIVFEPFTDTDYQNSLKTT